MWNNCLTLHVHLSNCLSHTQGEEYHLSHKRSWEEDYVLKQAFSALVPAFDPRPGRTNVPQIQDLEVPPPGRRTRTMRVVCMLLIPVIPIQHVLVPCCHWMVFHLSFSGTEDQPANGPTSIPPPSLQGVKLALTIRVSPFKCSHVRSCNVVRTEVVSCGQP